VFAGVDVGGRRKGFHVAVVDRDGVVVGAPSRWASVAQVVAAVRRAALVAVDAPRRPAPEGERSRPDERALARAVCSIRYTPDEATLRAPHRSDYYGWVLQGLALFAALAAADVRAVECFPTASLTRWGGPRAGRSRAGWRAGATSSSPGRSRSSRARLMPSTPRSPRRTPRWSFRGGRLAHLEVFLDWAQGLAAAGVDSEPGQP
jgi:predicted nuclease with RNAse H fold